MGLKINLVYDAQASAAPQSFRDAMQTAADQLQFVIYDNITINIGVGYGEFNGAALPGAVAEGGPAYGKYEAYSTLRAQLAASETSPTDVTAVNSLPSGNSINGISTISVTSAQEKALGLIAPADSRIDGYIGVPSTWPVNSLVAAALHEITHAMGRLPGTSEMALYRFSSPGTRVFNDGIPAPASYFSIDGGQTKLADFGVSSDPSDWLNAPQSSLTPSDPFDEQASQNYLTPLDLKMMDVLGFNVTPPNVQLAVFDTSTQQSVSAAATAYVGPVAGLQHQFIYGGQDNVNISVLDDNWFLHSGPGVDAMAAHGGYNVLDGGTGSNFLTGGSGTDTFFVDDRSPPADIWSTVNGFHAGDDATVFGINWKTDFSHVQWFDGQGAAGFTGLTLHVTTPHQPTASLTLPGYNTADLSNGRLSVAFGFEPDNTPFMHIIAMG